MTSWQSLSKKKLTLITGYAASREIEGILYHETLCLVNNYFVLLYYGISYERFNLDRKRECSDFCYSELLK